MRLRALCVEIRVVVICAEIDADTTNSAMFCYRIKFIHEEKLTSLAGNCATGCLQNELHIQVFVMELLGELSSAWDD